jgi:hypothetical protein
LAGTMYLLNDKKNESIEKLTIDEFMYLIIKGNCIEFEYFKKYIHSKTENTTNNN